MEVCREGPDKFQAYPPIYHLMHFWSEALADQVRSYLALVGSNSQGRTLPVRMHWSHHSFSRRTDWLLRSWWIKTSNRWLVEGLQGSIGISCYRHLVLWRVELYPLKSSKPCEQAFVSSRTRPNFESARRSNNNWSAHTAMIEKYRKPRHISVALRAGS